MIAFSRPAATEHAPYFSTYIDKVSGDDALAADAAGEEGGDRLGRRREGALQRLAGRLVVGGEGRQPLAEVAGEVGILNRSGGLAIRASTILGTTAAISSPSAAFITIALSQVGGPIVAAGWVSCTLSYDANNVSAGLNVCP